MPEGSLGSRVTVCAVDVRNGDFTTFSGYRHVVEVVVKRRAVGRGRKRTITAVGVDIHRCDGSIDRILPGDALWLGMSVYHKSPQ